MTTRNQTEGYADSKGGTAAGRAARERACERPRAQVASLCLRGLVHAVAQGFDSDCSILASLRFSVLFLFSCVLFLGFLAPRPSASARATTSTPPQCRSGGGGFAVHIRSTNRLAAERVFVPTRPPALVLFGCSAGLVALCALNWGLARLALGVSGSAGRSRDHV